MSAWEKLAVFGRVEAEAFLVPHASNAKVKSTHCMFNWDKIFPTIRMMFYWHGNEKDL